MGEGKTAVISPLLAACLADGVTLVALVMPLHLLEQSQEKLASVLRTPIVFKPFARLLASRGMGAYAPKLDADGKVSSGKQTKDQIKWLLEYETSQLIDRLPDKKWLAPGFKPSDEDLLLVSDSVMHSWSRLQALRQSHCEKKNSGPPLPACLLPRFAAHIEGMYGPQATGASGCGASAGVAAAGLPPCVPPWLFTQLARGAGPAAASLARRTSGRQPGVAVQG